MDYKIKCRNCGKAKSKEKYSQPWQRSKAVCNYCKDMYGVKATTKKRVVSSVTMVNADKKVKCLKCDRVFSGRSNVRICTSCKSLESYKEEMLKDHLTVSVAF